MLTVQHLPDGSLDPADVPIRRRARQVVLERDQVRLGGQRHRVPGVDQVEPPGQPGEGIAPTDEPAQRSHDPAVHLGVSLPVIDRKVDGVALAGADYEPTGARRAHRGKCSRCANRESMAELSGLWRPCPPRPGRFAGPSQALRQAPVAVGCDARNAFPDADFKGTRRPPCSAPWSLTALVDLRYPDPPMARRKNRQAQVKPRPAGAEGLLSEATARVEELVEAADRSAGAVRLSISEKLAELGETRRDVIVGELATELVERVESLREEAHELRAILVRATGALASGDAEAPDSGSSRDVTPARSSPGATQDARAQPAADEATDGPSQGLLLLATQMAVAGSDREEIAARLRDDFGVVDTDEVLDRALGTPT
jgi:hypothetical protein